MTAIDSDSIRDYARREYIEPARRRGEDVVRIQAGDIHRALGLNNRVPLVCSALASRAFLRENGLQLQRREGPPSGISTTVVFTYRLERNAEDRTSPRVSAFHALRGAGKVVFESLGGGEAFIRAEREEFASVPAPEAEDLK
jgi:hypothetical protein